MTSLRDDATQPASPRRPTPINPAPTLTVELGPPDPQSGRRTANLTIETADDSGRCAAEPTLDHSRHPKTGTRARSGSRKTSTHQLAPENLSTFINANDVTELQIASLDTAPLDETLDLLHTHTPLLRMDLETMSFDLTDTFDKRLAELVLVMTAEKLKEL